MSGRLAGRRSYLYVYAFACCHDLHCTAGLVLLYIHVCVCVFFFFRFSFRFVSGFAAG